MWQPYIGATREGLPDGDTKIVFDRFHIMREMTKAVDMMRKHEHRTLLQAGDSPLTGTKYLLRSCSKRFWGSPPHGTLPASS